MKPATLLSREDIVLLLERARSRRMFSAEDLREFASNLPDDKAFALSRLLPKDIQEKLLSHRDQTFADKVLNFWSSISKEGALVEVTKAKVADDQFLVTHAIPLLTLIGVEGY